MTQTVTIILWRFYVKVLAYFLREEIIDLSMPWHTGRLFIRSIDVNRVTSPFPLPSHWAVISSILYR